MESIKSIAYTLLFGSVMEAQIHLLSAGSPNNHTGSPEKFLGTIIFYAVLGVIFSWTFPWMMRRFSIRRRGFWGALIVHGVFGLVAFEWTLGNVPNNAFMLLVGQPGMFAWWAAIATLPWMFRQPESQPYRWPILRLYFAYAALSTIATLIVPQNIKVLPVILFEPPVYLAFFYYYRKIAPALDISDVTKSPVAATPV